MLSGDNVVRQSSAAAVADATAEAVAVAQAAADRIGILFETQGQTDYIGEAVSILEHSWQAYECAKQNNQATEHVQIASLLHDVGHMLGMVRELIGGSKIHGTAIVKRVKLKLTIMRFM